MRYLLITLALLTTMLSNAQETNTTEKANSKKIETKYDKYVSNYGTFLRFAEYNMPKLNLQGDWINETKIRQRQTADERKQVADAAVFCFSCTEGEKKDIIENHIEKPEN